MFKFADWLQNLPGGGFNFRLGGLEFTPSYFTAGFIVILIFVLVVTLAQVRRHFLDWSVKGAIFGLFFGFILALIFEGFLVIGGKTAVIELLGWKNPPKPIVNVLDLGRKKVVEVLGVESSIPSSFAQNNLSKEKLIDYFKSLPSKEAQEVRDSICKP